MIEPTDKEVDYVPVEWDPFYYPDVISLLGLSIEVYSNEVGYVERILSNYDERKIEIHKKNGDSFIINLGSPVTKNKWSRKEIKDG